MTMTMSSDGSPAGAPIAILGATSQIACDFLISCGRTASFALYARNPAKVAAFVAANGLPSQWCRGTLDELRRDAERGETFAAVINFVGVGDPAKAGTLAGGIFHATTTSDEIALEVSARNPAMPYIFLSSGAVYGDGFETPAHETKPATFQINPICPSSYYAIAKCHAEAIHRSCPNQTIIDLRIFNYISRTQDIGSRYFVIDMVGAIMRGDIFETSDEPMVRDFINPEVFRDLVRTIMVVPPGTNRPVDAYSAAPISKSEMLNIMSSEFGLKYKIVDKPNIINATGRKDRYYSEFKSASDLGYVPLYTSADIIRREVAAMLDANARDVRVSG